MAIPSRVRRISALSARIATRSSGFRRDSRASRSSIDGAAARIRRKASVVTQKPAGTRRPASRATAGRHTEACDPRKLSQVRALAADDRGLRLIDLLEIQHVAHPRLLYRPATLGHAPGLAASPPVRYILKVERRGRQKKVFVLENLPLQPASSSNSID